MSEQKWTPEPWYAHSVIPKGLHAGYVHAITNSKPGGIIEDADGVWVVDFPDWDHHSSRFILRTTDSDNSKDNAARIVQCVNALAGVANPAAELARLRGIEKVYAAAVEENRRWNEIVAEELAETRKLMDLLNVHNAVRDGKPCMEAVNDAIVDLLARCGAAVQDCIAIRNDKADVERSSVAAQYALRVQLDNARAMYEVAANECASWRLLCGEREELNGGVLAHHAATGITMSVEAADAHDTARAEAGMENL